MSVKKGFVYVFISNIIGLFISIITGFVLPKILSIDTYADIKLFQLYVSYIGILHFGFSDGMYLKYGGKAINEINNGSIKSEFKTFKLFQVIIMVICTIIALILRNNIILLCCLAIIPINVGNYLRNLYQATGKFDKYAKFTNINTLFTFFVNFFLLFIIKTDNPIIYILGYILSYFIYWILLELEVIKLFGKEKSSFDFQYIWKNIHDGFFLMLGNFSNVIFTSIDRLLVKYFLGTIKFAYYSFAVSIENLMNSVITPISVVMYNYLCKNQDKNKVISIKQMILVFSAMIIIVIYPVKFVVDLWIPKYEDSLNVLYLLFGAQYISIMIRCIHTNLYKAKKEQNKYFRIMICIVVFSILSNLLFYFIFKNIEGFAIATLITNIIWFVIGEYNFKEYRLPWKNYLYTFLVLFVFLVSSRITNAIFSLFIYLVLIIIFTILFMNPVLKIIKHEVKNVLKYKKF